MTCDGQEMFTPPLTFLNAQYGAPRAGCRAAVIGIPFDVGTHPNRVGARQGPAAVREASKLVRRFNPVHADFDPVQLLALVDRGDVRVSPARTVDALERIQEAVGHTIAAGAVPVTIGGDGMVSLGVLRGVAKKHSDLVLIHIDSHTDAYSYDEGSKDIAGATFTYAAEEGLLDASSSWHVGIRGTTYEQGVVQRANSLGYRVVSLDELFSGGFEATISEFRRVARGRPVYLCWDMDVFDPSVAPGVATLSWGGLSAREGIALLRAMTDLNIVAFDFNTVSPPHDVQNLSAHLCAQMIHEGLVLLCRQFHLA